jgi:hypothetical protein
MPITGQSRVLDPHDQPSWHEADETVAMGAQNRVIELHAASRLP